MAGVGLGTFPGMRTSSRGSAAVLAFVLMIASACGSSSDDAGSGGSSGGDFCEQIVALEAAAEGIEGDNLDEAALDSLRSLRDAAPDEIRDDMVLFVDVFEQLAEVDENDPESVEVAFGLLFDPAVIAAGENIEAYGVEKCGLEPESIGGNGSDSGIDDPLYNPDFDDPVDPNEASIDGLQLYLDETYPDAPWRRELSSFGQSGDDFQAGGVGIEADAIAVCEALLEYATGFAAEATVEVTTFTDDFADETPVATGNGAAGCVTV